MAIYDNFTNEITYKKKDGNYDIDYEVIEQSYTDIIDLAMFISAHCVEAGTPDVVEYFIKDDDKNTKKPSKPKPSSVSTYKISEGKYKNLIKLLMFFNDAFEVYLEHEDYEDIENALDNLENDFAEANEDINLSQEYGGFYDDVLQAFLDVITKNERDEDGVITDIIDFKKTKYDNFDEKDYLEFILDFVKKKSKQ